jgi:hypothetical protein
LWLLEQDDRLGGLVACHEGALIVGLPHEIISRFYHLLETLSFVYQATEIFLVLAESLFDICQAFG